MASTFNPGEKVMLVSGGPEMTIRGLHFDVLANEYNDKMFDCIWFEKDKDGKQEVHYCPFYTHEITRVKTDQ
jgi:uncharacterized protein YodC (DUF2158 family)